MALTIKRASVYIDSAKLAEMSDGSFDHNNNSEQMHGVEGILAATDGNQTVQFQFDTARPTSTSSALPALEDAMTTQTLVSRAFALGGKQNQVACKDQTAKISSESKSGTLKGSWTLINAENPKLL